MFETEVLNISTHLFFFQFTRIYDQQASKIRMLHFFLKKNYNTYLMFTAVRIRIFDGMTLNQKPRFIFSWRSFNANPWEPCANCAPSGLSRNTVHDWPNNLHRNQIRSIDESEPLLKQLRYSHFTCHVVQTNALLHENYGWGCEEIVKNLSKIRYYAHCPGVFDDEAFHNNMVKHILKNYGHFKA